MRKQKLIIIPLLSLCLCACGEHDFEMHSDKQLGYINDADYASIDKYTSGASVSADPLAYELSLNKTESNSKLVISESENFSKTYELKLDAGISSYDLYNLKVGTTTYWKEYIGKNEVKSGSIKTANTYPRNLYIKGVKNVRDLGFEGFIKQGLIYRGGEFNYMQGSMRNNIKAEGIEAVQQQLGVKTEIDLRFTTEASGTTSAVSNVNYIHVPMYYKGSGNVLTLKDEAQNYDNLAAVKDVFDVLADSDNYPVYFHCSAGKDRTGVIAYLINALMGCDETHIYKDYLFSNFVKADNVKLDNILTTYVADIKAADGATLKEKVTNYIVNNAHIESAKLASVIEILKD